MISVDSHINVSQAHKAVISLGEWEEYVGTLKGVEKKDGMTILEFDKCCVGFYRELNLEEYIGKKIGVLRTDIEGREVVVREV